MSCIICDCATLGLPNTGFSCNFLIGITHKLIFTPTFANDGTKNRIAATDTVNQAYIDALINQADASKRWYPTPHLDNVSLPRADTKYFTTNAGSKSKIIQGIRSLESLILNTGGAGAASPQVLGALSGMGCNSISVYIVTLTGQLLGKKSADGLYLEPFLVDAQSIDAIFVFPNDNDTVQGIQLRFDFSVTEQDSAINMIDCGEVTGADLIGIRGLLDVTAVLSNITENGFDFVLNTNFGTIKNPTLAQGWVGADFVVHNDTQNTDPTFTLTEPTPGNYTLAFTSPQNPGDEFTLSGTKTGYDLADNSDEIPNSGS